MPIKRARQPKLKQLQSSGGLLLARGPPNDGSDFPVVGIGASAGGLEACRMLVAALPADINMAFILVQHLDPTHESMMVDLLAGRTLMKVQQAQDGMQIESNHLYIIPPGTYLSVGNSALHVSEPQARHGARLPFDFLLHSLAQAYGSRAICVILSGTGADGSLGLKSIKQKGGFVIAQDPDEAAYDGMPRSAIATGAVNLVLAAVEIAGALIEHFQPVSAPLPVAIPNPETLENDWLPGIIDLLRAKSAHDFTLYKSGTLQRRIERRMAAAAIPIASADKYLAMLKEDPKELEALASDLLINVTNFFRDPKVFDVLVERIIPELVSKHTEDHPLRVWIAGCSTGEEAYSLAIVFREHITLSKSNVKLQIFASDIDSDAVAIAREGHYPKTIESDVSPSRLARFFAKDASGYTVMPELRSTVIFTVQDVLTDPPFSRLDMVSCRNLLIYLRPEAQAKIISLFHFALRPGGILLLGSSESIGSLEGRFQVLAKTERLFRHIGRSRPGEIGFSTSPGEGVHVPTRLAPGQAHPRHTALADLCQGLVMNCFAPAAVLINSKFECLFSLGPTDRYLHVPPGQPTHDLLAMARQDTRGRIMTAVQNAKRENARVVVAGGRAKRETESVSFDIDAQPVLSDGETLFLICFVEGTANLDASARPAVAGQSGVAEIQLELDTVRSELRDAVHNLELSGEEQRAINEEALSVKEEYQSTNEELTTSKEELQSLNEELTALNSQLQETLEKQRTTSDDLQNILYSTDVATLFLDINLNIRFFTPATKLLFNVIPGDVGRPIADLNSLAADGALATDARAVLQSLEPIEREIEARSGAWYIRRILPYRTQNNAVEGVVITFVDVTERVHVKDALRAAEKKAQLASVAKSRFLAAASHDLRQPLQSLTLLQGLLAKSVQGEKAQSLVAKFDQTLGAMSGMLNALLDINQIETGAIRPELAVFPINDLFTKIRDEYALSAQSQHLELHVSPCSLCVNSDPALLEQMIRNILSNALKYTRRGKVLIGCRRRHGILSIEIWDTGIGIPAHELQTIFDEYHQLDNVARERSRGLGLGLFIVRRLGILLGHRVHVRSRPGTGSVFAIDIALGESEANAETSRNSLEKTASLGQTAPHTGSILIVEDDPEVRELLEQLLMAEGHDVTTAPDGVAAFSLLASARPLPDLILADYNLPNGLSGTQFATRLRETHHRKIPVIILTGDISVEALRDIASHGCVHLNKPVKLLELSQAIQTLLAKSITDPITVAPPRAAVLKSPGQAVIFIVDDDGDVRDSIRAVLEDDGRIVEDYPTAEAFLAAWRPGGEACLLIDAYLPGMNGLELLRQLNDAGHKLPAIMITGNSDVAMAVQAMKAGALDFIEKPIGGDELLASVGRALEQSRDVGKASAWRAAAASHVADLTSRQREIMDLVLAGHPSKNIAADLGISQRTVENHRAAVMKRTGAKSLPALARLALAANRSEENGSLITSAAPVKPAK